MQEKIYTTKNIYKEIYPYFWSAASFWRDSRGAIDNDDIGDDDDDY